MAHSFQEEKWAFVFVLFFISSHPVQGKQYLNGNVIM